MAPVDWIDDGARLVRDVVQVVALGGDLREDLALQRRDDYVRETYSGAAAYYERLTEPGKSPYDKQPEPARSDMRTPEEVARIVAGIYGEGDDEPVTRPRAA